MPNELKHGYKTAVIGFRIKAEIKEQHTTQEILKDLWAIFKAIGSRWQPKDLDRLLQDHPLGAAIIEVLPE